MKTRSVSCAETVCTTPCTKTDAIKKMPVLIVAEFGMLCFLIYSAIQFIKEDYQ